MNTRKLMLIVVLGLTIAACNRAAETVQDVDTSTTEGVTAVSSPTTTSPTTTSPTTTTSTDSSTLSLVVIGDSFVGWSDWPEMYAQLASTALDMTVVVDESLAGPGTPRRLDQIRSSERAQQVIASADILVVQPQPGWVAAPAFNSYLHGECGGTNNTDCLDSAKDEYSAYANEYFDLLLELVNPGTIIRVATTASWGPDGFYPTLRRDDPEALFAFIETVVAIMEESERAASARGILTIDVGAAFNGSAYTELAPDDYLVGDRLHLAERGSEVVAELLHELGYEASVAG